MTQETQKPKRTQAEIVESMKREYYEIQSIKESLADLKNEAKAAGYPAKELNKLAKIMSEAKTDDTVQDMLKFVELVDEVRNS